MPRPTTTAKRLTTSLREPDVYNLATVVETTRLSENDAIRKALSTEAFVQQVIARGGTFKIENADGDEEMVAWVH